MKATELPERHQDTAVRKAMNRAELVRYWWEYRGRLRELLRVVDAAGNVRLDATERRAVRDYWNRFGAGYVNPDWYRLFKALNGAVDPQYLPEETFRTRIEPVLNRRDVSAAYHDKNQLDRWLHDVPRPRTILRNVYGSYADEHYQPIARGAVLDYLAERAGPHFLKPAISGTGSGRNVARVEFTREGFRIGQTVLALDDVERTYVQDFVVQEGVRQHPSLAQWHPSSLNTLRVITLRFASRIRPVAATLRVGNGSHVDNGHAGGLLCGVNVADGITTRFAVDVMFRRYGRHPLSGETFDGRGIMAFDAIKGLALDVHSRLPYFDVLSCDIGVTEDGAPCLIEVNTFGQGVEPHQYLKGRPLFDDETDAVLSMVAERSRSGWNR